MNKRRIILYVFGIVLVVIGVMTAVLITTNREARVIIDEFSIKEYTAYLSEFGSEKILGPVKDYEDALEKAESVWLEVFGNSVKGEKPYRCSFDPENGIWLVRGTVHDFWGLLTVAGGAANILIEDETGRVLAVWHDK